MAKAPAKKVKPADPKKTKHGAIELGGGRIGGKLGAKALEKTTKAIRAAKNSPELGGAIGKIGQKLATTTKAGIAKVKEGVFAEATKVRARRMAKKGKK